MIDPVKVLNAGIWLFEAADDDGFPSEQAVTRFELNDAESDALHELIMNLLKRL